MNINKTLKVLYDKNPTYWLAINRNESKHPKLSWEQERFINILKELKAPPINMSHYLKISQLASMLNDDILNALYQRITKELKNNVRQEQIANNLYKHEYNLKAYR